MDVEKKILKKLYPEGNYFMLGDDAVAYGAIFAGCKFYAGYPITPASEIAETLSRELPRVGGVYIQMEDEIASIAAIIGASWTGLKSMTATSGPGFSLMQENIGYAIMTETPIVVVDVQRSGPSTGQATKGAQGDYFQARWGTHGDHPAIAISPSSVQECFWLTIRAFNISEKLRTPVILLMDGIIGHLREQIKIPNPEEVDVFERKVKAKVKAKESEDDLVPPMPVFGRGNFSHVTGSSHRDDGFRDVYSPSVHDKLVRRLHEKIAKSEAEITQFEEKFTDDSEILVVSWGASARPSLGAVLKAREDGEKIGFFRPITVHPFPEKRFRRLAKGARVVIVPEMNLGQLILEVERFINDDIELIGVNRIGGVPLTVTEILKAIKRVI